MIWVWCESYSNEVVSDSVMGLIFYFILFYVNILFGLYFLAFCDLVWRESYSNGVAYVILINDLQGE